MEISTTHIYIILNFFILFFFLLLVYYFSYKKKIIWEHLKKIDALFKKYRHLFNSSSDGVFQANKKGQIMLINKAGASILGMKDPEEVTKASCFF